MHAQADKPGPTRRPTVELRNEIGPEAHVFISAATDLLHTHLRDDLLGLYLFGSLGTGDYRPGISDIDLFVVVNHPTLDAERSSLIDALIAAADPLAESNQVAGFEIVTVTADVAAHPTEQAGYLWAVEMYKAHGWQPDRTEQPGTDPTLLPAFELCRTHGRALSGPDAREAFGQVPHEALLAGARSELTWWVNQPDLGHEARTAVLNACRAWRLADERVLCSKRAGGEWARTRWHDSAIIADCLAIHAGEPRTPQDAPARELLLAVLEKLKGGRHR